MSSIGSEGRTATGARTDRCYVLADGALLPPVCKHCSTPMQAPALFLLPDGWVVIVVDEHGLDESARRERPDGEPGAIDAGLKGHIKRQQEGRLGGRVVWSIVMRTGAILSPC